MADGTHKRIKDITTGDRVVATDPETGKTETHKVTQLHTNQDTDLVDLAIRTSDGTTATIHTTSRHPFWSDDRRDGSMLPTSRLATNYAPSTATTRSPSKPSDLTPANAP
jgi:hypothetical protein